MKTCEHCGIEIGGRDGDNLCQPCDRDLAKAKARLRAKQLHKARADVLRSLGMVRVRGSLGGTYWE